MKNRLLTLVEETAAKKELPKFEVGDTVDVHVKILEGSKERTQIFNGVVIGRRGPSRTFKERHAVGGISDRKQEIKRRRHRRAHTRRNGRRRGRRNHRIAGRFRSNSHRRSRLARLLERELLHFFRRAGADRRRHVGRGADVGLSSADHRSAGGDLGHLRAQALRSDGSGAHLVPVVARRPARILRALRNIALL